MNLFTWDSIFYLLFLAAGFFLCMGAVLGMPGNLVEKKKITKIIVKVLGIVILAAWYGIPALAIFAVAAFVFDFVLIGRILCFTGFGLGLSVVLCMIALYKTKD